MDWMTQGETHTQLTGDDREEAYGAAAFRVRDDRPTLLVAGPSSARTRLVDWAARAGLRCIGDDDLGGLAQRISRTAAVDLVLVDLRGADLPIGALAALDPRKAFPRAGLLLLTDLRSVDMALAIFDAPDIQILCEPAAGEIIHLLIGAALAAERKAGAPRLFDSACSDDGEGVARLSEEVRRLAGTIDRLAQQDRIARSGPFDAAQSDVMRAEIGPGKAPAMTDGEAVTPAEIAALLRARHLRDRFLPADLFADPAWDMILDLMAARLSRQRVCVSSLCVAAAVPPTTALRWIRQLTERGLFARTDDKADGRRVFIALADEAADAVTAWAGMVRRSGGLLPPAHSD